MVKYKLIKGRDMKICKTGPNDLQPPEPEEEAEFKIKIECGYKNYAQSFTAYELNIEIEQIIEYMRETDSHYPIYLNGTEWDGNQLDEKDMAAL